MDTKHIGAMELRFIIPIVLFSFNHFTCQIIGPHDDEIVAIAEGEPQPRDEYWDIDEIEKNPLFNSADPCIDPYFAAEKEYNYKRYSGRFHRGAMEYC